MKRLLIVAGIVVAVLVVAAVAAPFFINVDSFRPELEKRLSAALSRPVHIGKLEASIFRGGAAAENIVIADDPAFNKGDFLKASSLTVGLRLIPLIFSREINVTSITVEKPEIVLLRNSAGKWNYSSLGAHSQASPAAKPGTESTAAPDFSIDKFEIVDGTVRVGQSSGHVAGKERVYQKVHLVARNISLNGVMPFTVSAGTPGGGALNLEGKFGPLDRTDSDRTPMDATVKLARGCWRHRVSRSCLRPGRDFGFRRHCQVRRQAPSLRREGQNQRPEDREGRLCGPRPRSPRLQLRLQPKL
jgi:AsmA protein